MWHPIPPRHHSLDRLQTAWTLVIAAVAPLLLIAPLGSVQTMGAEPAPPANGTTAEAIVWCQLTA